MWELIQYGLISEGKNLHYIPIININEEDIYQRFEFMYLFNSLEYEVKDLVFLNSFNLQKLIGNVPATEMVLVDHNVPSENLKDMIDRVSEIIDHHEDKTSIYKEGQLKKKIIQKVGSTTTLVFDEIMDKISLYKDQEKHIFWFILSTILVDTYNFNPKEKNIRWIDMDWKAAETLCKILNDDKAFPEFRKETGEIDLNAIFQKLSGLKFDPEMNLNLDMNKLFTKDYKRYTYQKARAGYSVIFFPFDDLAKKYSPEVIIQKCQEFKASEKLDILFLMFVHPKNKENMSDLSREIIIFCEDEKLLEDLPNYLIVDQKLSLNEISRVIDKKKVRCFIDTQSIYTRKTFEPMIAKFLS